MPQPHFKAIVAYANNRVIGNKNKIPWNLPSDMKHFKEITTGNIVIMGRKTFESLPGGKLPNRINIVLTKDAGSTLSDVENGLYFVSTPQAAVDIVNEHQKQAYVIGGAEIYKLFLSYCDEIIATEIHSEIQGDSYFPALSNRVWTAKSVQKNPNENGLQFDYVTYVRI